LVTLGPAPRDGGVADHVEIRFSFTCLFAKRGRSGSNGTSVITKIRRKILTPRVSSFKVTQGHRNRYGSIGYVTSYQCSMVTVGLSCTVFDINGENCKFFPPRAFIVPLRGFHWNFVTAVGFKKLE